LLNKILGSYILPNYRTKQKGVQSTPFCFIQAAGLVYHHDAVVYIIKGGTPPLYLITRQRAFSCGIDDIHGFAVIGWRVLELCRLDRQAFSETQHSFKLPIYNCFGL